MSCVCILYIPANLVLERTIERIYVGNQYAEKALGLFLVRGDNIVLLGSIVRSLIYPNFIEETKQMRLVVWVC